MDDKNDETLLKYMCDLNTGVVCDVILEYLKLPDCSPIARSKIKEFLTSKKEIIDYLYDNTPNMCKCIEYTDIGLMKYTGNQHDPRWGWIGLENLSREELIDLCDDDIFGVKELEPKPRN